MEAAENFIGNLVIPRKSRPKLDEATFFLEAFKPLNREEWELVKKHEDKLWRPMYGSVVFGVMLSLSLRRYIPRLRAAPMSTKSLLDIGLVLASTGFTAINFAVPRYLNSISDVRSALVEKSKFGLTADDPQYLRFLKQKYLRYGDVYPREVMIFQEFMKEDAFIKWYADSPQYVFEKGHEPKESHFTKKSPSKLDGKSANNSGQDFYPENAKGTSLKQNTAPSKRDK